MATFSSQPPRCQADVSASAPAAQVDRVSHREPAPYSHHPFSYPSSISAVSLARWELVGACLRTTSSAPFMAVVYGAIGGLAGRTVTLSHPSTPSLSSSLSTSLSTPTPASAQKCYNIHRRPNADLRGRTRITPLPPLNPLLGLLAAATSSPAQPSAAPSSPSFSTSPPPPLPLPPPPPPPLPPPSSAPCPLSDITNAPRRQRRHDTPLKRKRELAEAAAALDAAVHFSLSFALILLSCPHFSPSSLLIPFFYHLPPVVRRPHSAVSCSSAWEAPATWMQRKVSASCRAGASSRPCHLPPVIHCFKHGITLRSDRTYSCLRSLRHVGIGNSHHSLLLGRSRMLALHHATNKSIECTAECWRAILVLRRPPSVFYSDDF